MMRFCCFWYASKTGQNFAACPAVSVRFLAMMSALLLCISARRSFRTLSDAPDPVVVEVCWAGAWACAEATTQHTAKSHARIRYIAIPPEGTRDQLFLNPGLHRGSLDRSFRSGCTKRHWTLVYPLASHSVPAEDLAGYVEAQVSETFPAGSCIGARSSALAASYSLERELGRGGV